MIRKSAKRFSETIMLKRILKRDGTIALQVGNHWLRFPPKVVSQKLIKIRATRAARVTF
jgi:hypothetical protein